MYNLSNVRLPDKFWQQAQNNAELIELIQQYVRKCYPDYTVKEIKRPFAICEINR